jgi:hypothetical protein
MGKNGTSSGIPVYFEKLILYGLEPVLVLIVVTVFWGIVAIVKKLHLIEFRAKLVSTLIVVLFVIHPDIAKVMFSTFNCMEIDGVYHLKDNVRSVCY